MVPESLILCFTWFFCMLMGIICKEFFGINFQDENVKIILRYCLGTIILTTCFITVYMMCFCKHSKYINLLNCITIIFPFVAGLATIFMIT